MSARRNFRDFKIATMDFETDPFQKDRVPKPFAGGFYAEGIYFDEWGDDCVERLIERIMKLEEHYLIYVHNGAKFDFHFLYDYIEPPVFIKAGKLIEFSLGLRPVDTPHGVKLKPKHVCRDSLSILPMALKTFAKDEIDYAKMELTVREQHKTEIRAYLRSDCRYLWMYCANFVERFGFEQAHGRNKNDVPITIGKVSMGELMHRHPFKRINEEKDRELREFYYGGRTQCFQSGVIEGPHKVYDVNSQYPSAMRNFEHPVNGVFDSKNELSDTDLRKPSFVIFDGINRNAIPMRIKTNNGNATDFCVDIGRFYCCTHELRAALEHDLVKIDRIHKVLVPVTTTRFDTFIDEFYEQKTRCKRNGDKAGEIMAKLILNSAYGKFGQNPRKYKDYIIVKDIFNAPYLAWLRNEDTVPCFVCVGEKGKECNLCGGLGKCGWSPEVIIDDGVELWSRPARIFAWSFFDVSIGASITSAARSIMLDGIQQAENPLYCDTDSIICSEFAGRVDEYELGAWKYEGTGDVVAIAGKKTYALYNRGDDKFLDIPLKEGGLTVKSASKGGQLPTSDIIALCRGETLERAQAAPTFKFGKAPSFMVREFRATAGFSP